MANNLRVFNTNSEYQSADLILPAVSYVVETDKVIYEPTTPPTPVFQGKWKAIYSDGNVTSAECGSSSEIVNGEINKTNLVSVEIGDCVTSIGSRAFNGCSSLTSCTIGSGVTYIGERAFETCSSLTSVNLGSGVTSIGGGAFDGCSGLTSVTIPDSVTSIGSWAFQNCSSLTSVVIPDSVTSIDIAAFYHCTGLTSCTIGSGVTNVGSGAFYGCTSLTSITVNAVTPPILGNAALINTNNCAILVPSQSVSVYKSASGWSQYASRIYPIP